MGLDLRGEVKGQDNELGRIGSDALVLRACKREPEAAISVSAFAEVLAEIVYLKVVRDILDAFVDLAEEGLVSCHPFLALVHANQPSGRIAPSFVPTVSAQVHASAAINSGVF